jgi:hypothetical protein
MVGLGIQSLGKALNTEDTEMKEGRHDEDA